MKDKKVLVTKISIFKNSEFQMENKQNEFEIQMNFTPKNYE